MLELYQSRHKFKFNVALHPQRPYFRTIRDGDPSKVNMVLNAHRNRKAYWGRGESQDSHLDFHAAPEL